MVLTIENIMSCCTPSNTPTIDRHTSASPSCQGGKELHELQAIKEPPTSAVALTN
jgi:hypothetical protein